MKKTLIALAVAASAVVSGSVMAADWVEGGNGGDVNFGGEITAQNNVAWMWLLGEGKTDFANTTLQMTEGGKKLAITAEKDIPILAGKLKHGIKGEYLRQAGTMPQITFLSAGSPVTPEYATNGAMSLTIKTFDNASSEELGTLKINGRSAGSVAYVNDDQYFTAALATQGRGGVMSGGLSDTNSDLVWTGTDSSTVVTKFGGPTLAELQQQVKDVMQNPDAAFTDKNNIWSISREVETDMNVPAYGISYGYGVEQGSTLEATFSNPVTSTTVWKAPLTVSISYN